MKNKLPIIAIMFGCSLAFGFKEPAKNNLLKTWCYLDSGSATNPASYEACEGPLCASGNVHICAIIAPPDSSNPSEPLIDAALATRISNKDTSMGDVFLKR